MAPITGDDGVSHDPVTPSAPVEEPPQVDLTQELQQAAPADPATMEIDPVLAPAESPAPEVGEMREVSMAAA